MRMVFSRVLLNRSTWAFAAGHRGVILRCLMPNCLHHAANSSDPKGALSDVMTSGIPWVANVWVRCVMAVAAELEPRVTWTSGYTLIFHQQRQKILSGWKWATVINMDGVPFLFWWICHSEGLWGRCGAHDLATKAFAYLSLSLNIYARPPDSLSEILFNFRDVLTLSKS